MGHTLHRCRQRRPARYLRGPKPRARYDREDQSVPEVQTDPAVDAQHRQRICKCVGQPELPFSNPLIGRGAAFGDLNNDGQIDVVIATLDGAPVCCGTMARRTIGWACLWLVRNPIAMGLARESQ